MGESLPTIDYTARDFATIKTALQAHLAARFPTTWKNFYEDSTGMAWLELVAYSYAILSFYLDYQANEMYLPTLQDRENAVRVCKLVGYNLQAPSAASVTVTMEITAVQLNDVVIAAGTTLSATNDVPFEFLTEARVPAGSLSATATATQGEAKTDTFASDGSVFQRFTLTGMPVIDGSVTVTVDGTAWTVADSLVYGDATSQIYAVTYDVDEDGNDIAYIEFGDGTSGVIPTSGAVISVSYRVGGGIAGNIALNQIDEDIDGTLDGIVPVTTVTVSVSNPNYRGSGGEERETVNHAKYWAPQWVRTNGRAVTEADFDVLATRFSSPTYGSLAYAKANLRQELPELNTVDLYCISGDTKIPLLDGTEPTIAELAESKRDQFYIYAVKDGKITAALARKPRLTKHVDELIRLSLDNGGVVECTADHRVMLRDGSYREAGDLQVGESLMPLVLEEVEENSWRDGYLRVFHPNGKKQMVHQMVVKDVLGGYPDLHHVCHHEDFDKHNNNPANLLVVPRNEHVAMHRKLVEALWDDPAFRQRMAAKHSLVMRGLWRDPAFRAKMREVSSEAAKRTMANPEHKERMREVSRNNGRNTMAKLWSDPEFRKQHSKRHSALMKKTRAKLDKDPRYKRLQSAASRKALTALWKDPEFRQHQAELRAERNADPKYQRAANLGRYRAIAARAIACGEINEEIWNAVRGNHGPHFTKAIERFGSVEQLVQELDLNHKITAVECVQVPGTPVYDLTVDGPENFAIGAGVFVHNCWSRDSEGAPTTASTALKAAVQDYFDNNESGAVRLICADTEVQDGVNLYMDVALRIAALSNYSTSDVIQNVRTAIQALFASSTVLPGVDFRLSSLYRTVQTAAGVDYGLVTFIRAGLRQQLTLGTGDGATTVFAGTFASLPILEDTVVIQAGVLTLTDDGDGNLAGDGTGTINYTTGAVSATFATAPQTAENVVATSRYMKTYQRGATETTVLVATSRFRDSVSNPPVVPNTFGLSDGAQVVIDDGSGNLIGDVSASGNNTIDYATGSYDVTFAAAVIDGASISSTYRQYLDLNSGDVPVDKSELSVLGNLTITTI